MKSPRRQRMAALTAAALCLVAAGCNDVVEQLRDIATDFGVTSRPCPKAVNPDNGCIYLGTISDSGPDGRGPTKQESMSLSALSMVPQIVASQAAFWNRVNQAGGIGGYDIDVTTQLRDNEYSVGVHRKVYQQIRDEVLALAQSQGLQTTVGILGDLTADSMLAVPASQTSAWLFQDAILETGASTCVDAMNAVDYSVDRDAIGSVLAVHFPGYYGADGAAGAALAAQAHDLPFSNLETRPGDQGAAVAAILGGRPDLVVLSVSPPETATIVEQAVAGGFTGRFIGSVATWNRALLRSSAAAALRSSFLAVAPWESFAADTPGHRAMRAAIGEPRDLSDGYTSGWIWSYALKAALELAIANGDLTQEGLLRAAGSLERVDFEGMLPEAAGNHSGDPSEVAFRQSVINGIDLKSPLGISTVEPFFTGSTAAGYDFQKPCYEAVVF